MNRIYPLAFCLLSIAAAAPLSPSCAAVLFSEDFESLPLGPNVDEGLAGSNVWTGTPPAGWSIDNSGVPGIGNPNEGVTEWEGWSFADKDWWTQAAGDQNRSLFTLGRGTVMVADPDEWDDLGNPEALGTYNTFISTPPISLDGVEAGQVNLQFDSSWRDEDNQKANLTVSYDGGAPIEVFRWVSTPTSDPNFKDDAENETVLVPLNNPEGAGEVVITWGMFDAGNDWWWAVDNINVFTGNPAPSLRIDTTTGQMFLEGGARAEAINGYEVASASGSLDPDNWALGNLGAQGIDAVAGGDDPGERWETLLASDRRLSEAFLLGNSFFDASRTESLGFGYDTQLDARDVAFVYSTTEGLVLSGEVSYFASTLILGDMDDDGDVDFDDIAAFALGLNDPAGYQEMFGVTPALRGDIDEDGDLDFDDIPGFVSLLSSASAETDGGLAAVPEPSSGLLLVLVAPALGVCRRRHGLRHRCVEGR